MKKIASLFGGAMRDTETQEYKDTIKIGVLLARLGYTVKNGGYYGLMEAVSLGASRMGGEVIGITCESFSTTKGNDYLTETKPEKDLFDRLRALYEDTSVFIIQKGSVGTLSELFTIWDIVRKEKNAQMYLIGEFWNPIIESMSGLISKKDMKFITICDTFDIFAETLLKDTI